MDNISGKFNVFDFFNLIATGIFTLMGLQLLGIKISSVFDRICSLDFFSGNNEETTIQVIWVISSTIGLSYVIGSFFQEINSIPLFENFIFYFKEKAHSCFLNDPKVIGNECKRMIYVEKAKQLFATKQINIQNSNFTPEQCKYFFAYCIYFNQIKQQHEKTEKMRELEGISGMLTTSCCFLFLCGVSQLFCNNHIITKLDLFLVILFAILTIIFYSRTKRNTIYRIRMVLGIYEVNCDNV